MQTFKISILLLSLVVLGSCLNPSQKYIRSIEGGNGIYAKIVTEKGIIVAKLEYEKAPLTVASFIGLAQGIIPNEVKKPGIPFYDGLKFYKVFQSNRLIAGCPNNEGNGHPGYLFADEFHKDLKHDTSGVLSMQSNGPNTNGSQFVITQRANAELDNKNPVFGKVVFGMDIVNRVQQGEIIIKIEIIKIGRKAKAFNPLEIFKTNGFEHMIKH